MKFPCTHFFKNESAAYVLPALFYFKIEGYSHLAMFVLVVGTSIGLVGTFYSMKQLINDSQ